MLSWLHVMQVEADADLAERVHAPAPSLCPGCEVLRGKGVVAPRFAYQHPIPLVLRVGSPFSGWGAYQAG